MSRKPTSEEWQELYQALMLGSVPINTPGLLDQAYRVIQQRAFELSYAGAPVQQELQELEGALLVIDVIRSLGPVEAEGSPVYDLGECHGD